MSPNYFTMLNLLCVLQTTTLSTGTVHTVVPDDHHHPNTTCHHCHNLLHYLLNTTKYFTSNTQLLFLPGLHHLHTDLIIQNVDNISLVGNGTTNDTTPEVVIQCKDTVVTNLTIMNTTNFIMNHFVIKNCFRPLLIMTCKNVVLHQLHIQAYKAGIPPYPLTIINTLGRSYFSYVTLGGIYLKYDDEDESLTDGDDHVILIEHYKVHEERLVTCTQLALLNFSAQQSAYKVVLKISHTIVKLLSSCKSSQIFMHATEITGIIAVNFVNCHFINFYSDNELKNFQYPLLFPAKGVILNFRSLNSAKIHFHDCTFSNNSLDFQLTLISFSLRTDSDIARVELLISKCQFLSNTNTHALIAMQNYEKNNYNIATRFANCTFVNNTKIFHLIKITNIEVELSNCMFINNSYTNPLTIRREGHELGVFLLENVNITFNTVLGNVIDISNIQLVLRGQIIFYNNEASKGSIISNSEAFEKQRIFVVLNRGEIHFSNNFANNIIQFTETSDEYIYITENTQLVFSENCVCSIFGIMMLPYPMCIFQYYSVQSERKSSNYSIVFEENYYYTNQCYRNIPLIDCRWASDSLFANRVPVEVNKQFIKYINNSGTFNMAPQSTDQRTICICTPRKYCDCRVNELGYYYPGQELDMYVCINTEVSETPEAALTSGFNLSYIQPCIVTNIESLPFAVNNCTRVNYTMTFPLDIWCALLLRINTDSSVEDLNIFYVRQLPCPAGFTLANKKCVCYPTLVTKFKVQSCNINDQTILRSANSWISATLHNNSFTYHISLQCPFQYCLPYSSHINLSTPSSQCQFNRSGVLCGQCSQNLSTIFASSQCQHCSSVYLLHIVPIGLAGFVLVLCLFILNLTVTDGIINAFILYTNIAGINSSMFFRKFTPAYIFTSLTNLDLGIPTCFYNGMDDYAKMWLQLAFPFYLIFIATLLIITSRYSTTIQRLTARRALPVLATLFLLSYTKILHTVSCVLFSYSTITKLPGEQSTIAWSVDANVPLLGVRFIILFITCLIIFLIQVPFTIILLFSRPLQRFHCINKFKPLLDAYQGPYKDKFYYWTGLQLLVRVVFLGISVLEPNISIMIGNIVVAAICLVTGIMHPFKSALHNYQELLLLFNLQILYIFVQNSFGMIAINTILSMALVHFSLIVIYHIITYMCGGVIRNKIQQGINTVMGWMVTKSANDQRFELANVPEVAFNYHEYREPLVALDH